MRSHHVWQVGAAGGHQLVEQRRGQLIDVLARARREVGEEPSIDDEIPRAPVEDEHVEPPSGSNASITGRSLTA
jgi:hypothetical protein